MATLHGMVSRNDGDAVIFFDGATETRLTYGQLHEKSDAVASILKETRDRNGRMFPVVGIHMEMIALVPVCILGVLKAGCCFVYLSPNESVGYLKSVINRANAGYLIADQAVTNLESSGFPLKSNMEVLLDDTIRLVTLDVNVPVSTSPRQQLAYIMLTSGSTGESKMVRVTHSCIVPNIIHLWNEYNVSPSDLLILSSPLTFDPSVVDIFLALSSGATLLIVSDEIKAQPTRLALILFTRYRITVLQTTPSLLLRFPTSILKRVLCNLDGPLRVLTLGGEQFPYAALAPYLCNIDDCPKGRLRVYNIYGTTEVSCWATLHKVTAADIRRCAVPIGHPMLGTEIQLVNEAGALVDEEDIIGELRIGGASRRCLVDDEAWPTHGRDSPPRLRPTGDLAVRQSMVGVKQYYIIGRSDEQVKRMGKRINLVEISQVLEHNVNVRTCVTILDSSSAIRAFVQLNGATREISDCNNSFEIIANELRKTLTDSLPSHCRVDSFHFVDFLPVTRHGKIDKTALMRFANPVRDVPLPDFSQETIRDGLAAILEGILCLNRADVSFSTSFRALGMDSLRAVRSAAKLEQWTGRKLPKALDILLSGTGATLTEYITTVANGRIDFVAPGIRKSEFTDESPVSGKRPKYSPTGSLRIVEKCGRVRMIGNATDHPPHGRMVNIGKDDGWKIKWKWDSGKCIDASPVVVEDLDSCRSAVYIGSHSGKFVSLNCATGAVLWQHILDDRIEASATLTGCGKYVVVGCYDGGVYFFNRLSGDWWWTFRSEEAVKCTACVGAIPCIFIGSYDHRLYKLDYQRRQCMWSVHLGSAVFSTPVFSTELDRIFVAALDGTVRCLNNVDGSELWCRQLYQPVFSSLLLTDGCLVTPCVNGCVYWISAADGSLVNRFELSGRIFSTASLWQFGLTRRCLLIACDSGLLYCLDCSGAKVFWIKQLGGAISSSPFVFETCGPDEKTAYCCIATKNGIVHMLKMEDGNFVRTYCDKMMVEEVIQEENLPYPIGLHRIICYGDCGLYLIGGATYNGAKSISSSGALYNAQMYKFNLSTRKWTKLRHVTPSFTGHPDGLKAKAGDANAVLVSRCAGFRDGRQLLIAGGRLLNGSFNVPSDATYIYDVESQITTNLFPEIPTGDPNMARLPTGYQDFFDQVLLKWGRTYVLCSRVMDDQNGGKRFLFHQLVIGGTVQSGQVIRRAMTGWKDVSPLPSDKEHPRVGDLCEMAIYDGYIYCIDNNDAENFADVQWRYNLSSRQWERVETIPDALPRGSLIGDDATTVSRGSLISGGKPACRLFTSCVTYGDCAYLAGGSSMMWAGPSSNPVLSDVWRLHLPTLRWSLMPARLPVGLWFHSADVSPSGFMYVFGGFTDLSGRKPTQKLWRFALDGPPALCSLAWRTVLRAGDGNLEEMAEEELKKLRIPLLFVMALKW